MNNKQFPYRYIRWIITPTKIKPIHLTITDYGQLQTENIKYIMRGISHNISYCTCKECF